MATPDGGGGGGGCGVIRINALDAAAIGIVSPAADFGALIMQRR